MLFGFRDAGKGGGDGGRGEFQVKGGEDGGGRGDAGCARKGVDEFEDEEAREGAAEVGDAVDDVII